MSLQREYTMTINKETSVLNKNLTISTNDQGIDIIFRLIDCPYIKLSLKQNLYARIILLDPLGKQIDSDITSIVENRVIFKLTKNLMANIKCTGVYKLYIAIMDDKTNVNLLPPIKCTIEESEIKVKGLSVGLVNQSAIDNSLNTDYGNEIALFNADGSYNRTVWISGDMITTARMNKLEDAASVSRDEILNLKEKITELNKKNMVKVMVGTEYEPIIISDLNKGFYIISGYVQDFPNKNPYLLSDENYFMVTFSDGNYSKIIRCLSGEEDFVKYKYDKTLEVIYKNEQELVVCKQAEGYVGVTLDEYQYIELNEDREVILPKPDSFTEIKLYVDAKQSDKLTFDGVIWNEPLDLELGEMNTIYLSYINDKWYGSTNSHKDASDSSGQGTNPPSQGATTHTCRETLFPSNGEVQLTSAPIQDLTLYSDCTIKIPSELSGKNVTLNVINTNDLTLRFSQDAKYHTFNLKAGTMSMFNINIDSEDSRIIRLHCIEDIIGDGDTIVEKYSITRHLSNSTINNTSNLIEKNGSYNATISANSGYEIESIVVTMGGTDISSTVVSGKRINIPNVTGDIVIMVTTTAVQITYTITNNLSHCTTNNNSNVISEGSSYRAIVTPNVGYQIERTTVTMGGTDISSTVVTGNNINIASVTGDIVITVIATASVSTPTTYTVTNNLSHCSTSNASNTINKNESYNATISANSGYEIESIIVTMGGTNVTSTVVNGNNINIPNVTGDIVITVQATTITVEPTTYSITNNLSNCTTNNSSTVINKNESYNATISAKNGYTLSSFDVTMGGVDITSQVVSGNNISIPNVTGDVVIIVIATPVQITYSITNNLSHCTTNNSKSTINENESYNATISANDGYEIDGIVVTMGGVDISSQVVSGNNISISSVTGDIVIMVTTTETTVVQTTYSITNNLSNCTTNNASEVINENESYNATISANDGYEIKSIVVTMGGTNVSSTVVNRNKISIPNVTGILVITVTTNKIESGGELKDFPYADDLVEIAMTYWRNANNEYVDGQPWSQGITYRASNTPLSAYCEASMSSENSFWVSIKGRHYKAMDCSTLVGLCLRGYTYENGPYANETKFNAFRTDRNQTNPSVSWAFAVPREAASIGKYCYDNNWIVPLSTIGNSSNNYAGLKKGDIIFWAKKKSDGNYKEPDRFMKISHVAIVYGNSDTFNGRLSIIESTNVTPKLHTWSDGTTLNCGVRIKDLVNSKPDEVVLVARIQL